jgi:hypothetical protein
MKAARIYLMIQVSIWTPYGIYCALNPGSLEAAAGLAANSAAGTTELRAMYGGLQASIGLLCLNAVRRPEWTMGVLLAVCFLSGGLALARGFGLAVDGGASGYTLGALGFEILNTLAAIWLLRSQPNDGAVEAS